MGELVVTGGGSASTLYSLQLHHIILSSICILM